MQDGPSKAPSCTPTLQNAQATTGQMVLTGPTTGLSGPTASLSGPTAGLTTGLTGLATGLTGPTAGLIGSVAGSVTALSPAPTAVPPTVRLPFPSLCQFSANRPNKVTASLNRLFQPYSKGKKKKKKECRPAMGALFFLLCSSEYTTNSQC